MQSDRFVPGLKDRSAAYAYRVLQAAASFLGN